MATMNFDFATLRSPTSVAGARNSTRDFLDNLEHPVTAQAAETVILVASELVTNSHRDSYAGFAGVPTGCASPLPTRSLKQRFGFPGGADRAGFGRGRS